MKSTVNVIVELRLDLHTQARDWNEASWCEELLDLDSRMNAGEWREFLNKHASIEVNVIQEQE